MRSNLKEGPPQDADELAVAQGNYGAAEENKARAEQALADARTRLAEIEAKVKASPRDVIDTILRDRLIAREKVAIFEADVADAEAARLAAADALSEVSRVATMERLAADGTEHVKSIEAAEQAIVAAVAGLVKTIEARNLAVEAAEHHNKSAHAYNAGRVTAISTREFLHELGKAGPLRVEVVA